MGEQEAWVRMFCAALQVRGQFMASGCPFTLEAAEDADEGLRELRRRVVNPDTRRPHVSPHIRIPEPE